MENSNKKESSNGSFDSKKKRKPDFAIPIITLSPQKIVETKKSSTFTIDDFKVNFVLSEFIYGKFAVTAQLKEQEWTILKLTKKKYPSSFKCKLKEEEMVFHFKNDSEVHDLSLVKCQALYMQFYRFKFKKVYYLSPCDTYVKEPKELDMYKGIAYRESQMLRKIYALCKKYFQFKDKYLP